MNIEELFDEKRKDIECIILCKNCPIYRDCLKDIESIKMKEK